MAQVPAAAAAAAADNGDVFLQGKLERLDLFYRLNPRFLIVLRQFEADVKNYRGANLNFLPDMAINFIKNYDYKDNVRSSSVLTSAISSDGKSKAARLEAGYTYGLIRFILLSLGLLQPFPNNAPDATRINAYRKRLGDAKRRFPLTFAAVKTMFRFWPQGVQVAFAHLVSRSMALTNMQDDDGERKYLMSQRMRSTFEIFDVLDEAAANRESFLRMVQDTIAERDMKIRNENVYDRSMTEVLASLEVSDECYSECFDDGNRFAMNMIKDCLGQEFTVTPYIVTRDDAAFRQNPNGGPNAAPVQPQGAGGPLPPPPAVQPKQPAAPPQQPARGADGTTQASYDDGTARDGSSGFRDYPARPRSYQAEPYADNVTIFRALDGDWILHPQKGEMMRFFGKGALTERTAEEEEEGEDDSDSDSDSDEYPDLDNPNVPAIAFGSERNRSEISTQVPFAHPSQVEAVFRDAIALCKNREISSLLLHYLKRMPRFGVPTAPISNRKTKIYLVTKIDQYSLTKKETPIVVVNDYNLAVYMAKSGNLTLDNLHKESMAKLSPLIETGVNTYYDSVYHVYQIVK